MHTHTLTHTHTHTHTQCRRHVTSAHVADKRATHVLRETHSHTFYTIWHCAWACHLKEIRSHRAPTHAPPFCDLVLPLFSFHVKSRVENTREAIYLGPKIQRQSRLLITFSFVLQPIILHFTQCQLCRTGCRRPIHKRCMPPSNTFVR